MGYRVAYLGNFKHSFCTESHISKTLELLGHTVERLQEDEVRMLQVADIANQSDLFLWTRTPDLVRFDGVELLKNIHKPKVSYHLDLYCGIRENQLDVDPFFKTDAVFQADGEPESCKIFAEKKINAYWFPPAVFEPECYIAPAKDEFKSDIAFVGGTTSYHKEWPYRLELIEWLQKNYTKNFKIYPNEESGAVMDDRLNQLMSSAKILIADTLCMNFTHKNYWSNRIPEETGRGGFVIAPKINGLEKFYKDKKHLVNYEYGNFVQLKDLIDYYLTHDKERYKIKLAGHLHTKKHHTFTQRIEQMFSILKKEGILTT